MLTRDGEAVWVDGLPAQRGMCSYCGALASGLASSEYPVSYDGLMAASGMAFRVRWFRGAEGEDCW